MSRYFYAQYEKRSERGGRAGGWSAGSAQGTADPHGPDEAYEVLWLRTGAPPEVIRAAYRALAARLHPDVGGDAAAMRRLNAAYALLLSGRD